MRGNEWNRLVGEPSAMDVEAALADVRIRAVPIARRDARNRRAMSFMVGALLLGGSFFTGQLMAGGGVHVGDVPENNWSVTEWSGRPVLEASREHVVPIHVVGAGPTLRRYRITSWTEWYGVRYEDGESWVEGPPGTSLAFWYGESNSRLEGSVDAIISADSVTYHVGSFLRSAFGTSARHLALFEEGFAETEIRVARGQPVVLRPFGKTPADEPSAFVQIDGPDAGPPVGMVRWDSLSNFAVQFSRFGYQVREGSRMAQLVGARNGHVRYGRLGVRALFSAPRMQLRVSVAGRGDFGLTGYPGAQRVIVPGITDTLRLMGSRYSFPSDFCFTIMRDNWRAVERERQRGEATAFRAVGCLSPADRWTPVEVTASNGQRIRVQLVKLPDVNY